MSNGFTNFVTKEKELLMQVRVQMVCVNLRSLDGSLCKLHCEYMPTQSCAYEEGSNVQRSQCELTFHPQA